MEASVVAQVGQPIKFDVVKHQSAVMLNAIISGIFASYEKLPDTVQYIVSNGVKEIVLPHKELLKFVNSIKNPTMKENCLGWFNKANLARLALMPAGTIVKILLNMIMEGKDPLKNVESGSAKKSEQPTAKAQEVQSKVAPVGVQSQQIAQVNTKKVSETKNPASAEQVTDNQKVYYSMKGLVGMLSEEGYLTEENAKLIAEALEKVLS